MVSQSAQTAPRRSSIDSSPEYLVFLSPTAPARARLASELAAAGLAAESVGPGLRLPVGETDWQALLQDLAGQMSEIDRRDTRLAIIARNSDDRSTRRALAMARAFEDVLSEYSDSWLCEMMQRKGLTVHFQPLIQYPPGRVHGYECLIRGLTPDGDLIPPSRLFGAAQRLGMEYLLDRQACQAAITAAASVGFANLQFFISMMAGGVDKPDVLASASVAAAAIGGLRPGQITFQIVDAESVRDRHLLIEVSQALRDAGFSISLDDITAGSPLLASLRDLQPNYIRFEAGLCRRAAQGEPELRLLAQLCETARQHGAIAIARGLESEEQLRAAIDSGARITQGIVHAEPDAMPLEAKAEDQVLRQVRRTAILAFE